MDPIETTLLRLLEGKAYQNEEEASTSTDGNDEDLEQVESDFVPCDYTLNEQIDELTAKGIECQVKNYKPICQKSVTYIVAAVIFNSKHEILMMQEAKSSCAGTWYLPAGRVESGEGLIAAVKREVLEETGLIFDPVTLIVVESSKGNWYRFVFTGSIIGGTLKTAAQADSESICADWIQDMSCLNLRSGDILPLIDKGRDYWTQQNSYHQPILPSNYKSFSKLLLTLVVIARKRENNQAYVLTSSKVEDKDSESRVSGGHHHLPTCEINPTRSIHATLKRFMQYIFGGSTFPHKPHGLLNVEYSGRHAGKMDGANLSLLVSIKVPVEEAVAAESFHWIQVNPLIQSFLLQRLHKNLTLSLRVL